MTLPELGQLYQHPDIPEWLISSEVAVPYFDGQRFEFTIHDLTAADEADTCRAVSAFLTLGPRDRVSAGRYVYANYRWMASLMVHPDDIGCSISSEAEVWRFVEPKGISVSRRPRHDRAIYVTIEAECEWDREHGLQIVYRHGSELSRVSQQDGHLTHADAYDLPEDEDKIA